MPYLPFIDLLPNLVCTSQLISPDPDAALRLLMLAPFLEEWVVRAGFHEWLIQHGHGCFKPLALSTSAFGLLHLGSGWQATLLVMPPGLALALLYQYRRDWRLCALLHCGLNAMAIGGCAFSTI